MFIYRKTNSTRNWYDVCKENWSGSVFFNSKAKKNYIELGRVPARTRWTDVARKKREQ